MSADQRHHLERVADRGRHRDPGQVVSDAADNVVTYKQDPPPSPRPEHGIRVAAAALAVAAVVGVVAVVGVLERPEAEVSTATSGLQSPTHLFIPDGAGVEIVDTSEGAGPQGGVGQIVVYGQWVDDNLEAVAVSVTDGQAVSSLQALVAGEAVDTSVGPAVRLGPSESFDLSGLSLARGEQVVFVAGRGVDQELLQNVIEQPDPTHPEAAMPVGFIELYRGPDSALSVIRPGDQVAVRNEGRTVYLSITDGYPAPTLVTFLWGAQLEGDTYTIQSNAERFDALLIKDGHSVVASAKPGDAGAVPGVLDLLTPGTSADFNGMSERAVEPGSMWGTTVGATVP